jgi:hypothetical protein
MDWSSDIGVFEVNALVWVLQWSRRTGRESTLADLPASAWDEICISSMDAVWLMGVWERSPAGIAIAKTNETLAAVHRAALADFTDDDVVGSPYCIRRYEADPRLGGREGLKVARRELERRGCGLVLDFVPNHVAPDHPWTIDDPSLFVQGSDEDLRREPDAFLRVGDHVIARGRDPYFPAWPEVVQLNAFNTSLSQRAAATLIDIGDQCDAVRCDMAMLLLNDVFARTWGARAGEAPATEYWERVLSAVRDAHPDMGFLAEAYWDLEWRLIDLGFDACYDKRLYDRLAGRDNDGVRAHLAAPVDGQRHLVRFTENHDEPRACETFGPATRAAAVVIATIPGVTLWHEGQAEGHERRLPVLLGRRAEEPDDADSVRFHHALWEIAAAIRRGTWSLVGTSGWPDNDSHRQLLAWTWQDGDDATVVVVNDADRGASGMVDVSQLPIDDSTVRFTDRLSGATYERDGAALRTEGLYVELPPFGCHIMTGSLVRSEPAVAVSST